PPSPVTRTGQRRRRKAIAGARISRASNGRWRSSKENTARPRAERRTTGFGRRKVSLTCTGRRNGLTCSSLGNSPAPPLSFLIPPFPRARRCRESITRSGFSGRRTVDGRRHSRNWACPPGQWKDWPAHPPSKARRTATKPRPKPNGRTAYLSAGISGRTRASGRIKLLEQREPTQHAGECWNEVHAVEIHRSRPRLSLLSCVADAVRFDPGNE